LNLVRRISDEQVQNETSDRDATLLTCLINTIRRGIGLAGRFDGDVVVTGNLFKSGSSSKIDQPVDPGNTYTQESRCLFNINLLSRIARSMDPKHIWKETASMNAITKETQTTKEFDQLKIRLKTTWMTGDYDLFSRYLEKHADRVFRRPGVTPGIRLLDVGCGAAPDPILRG